MTLLRPAYIYRNPRNAQDEWNGREVYLIGPPRTIGGVTFHCVRTADTGEEGYVVASEIRRTGHPILNVTYNPRDLVSVPAGVPA